MISIYKGFTFEYIDRDIYNKTVQFTLFILLTILRIALLYLTCEEIINFIYKSIIT